MNWYYVEDGKQAGPASDEQFNEMVRTGRIRPDTLVWHEGMAEWVTYSDASRAANATGAGAGTAQAVCAECGKTFPMEETIGYGNVRVCAACKPVFLQKLQEGAAINTGEMRYAGFWIRVGAKILDGLIIGVPLGIIFFVFIFLVVRTNPQRMGAFSPLLSILIDVGFLFIQVSYQVFFLGKYGATPGKMICGIKVVTSEGGRISYGRATGRVFAEILSALICYIGYIMVAFDGEKRGLHDHICNTRVIYK